jgi:hypothetical protein
MKKLTAQLKVNQLLSLMTIETLQMEIPMPLLLPIGKVTHPAS